MKLEIKRQELTRALTYGPCHFYPLAYTKQPVDPVSRKEKDNYQLNYDKDPSDNP